MTNKNIEEITNHFIGLKQKAEYKGTGSDPYRQYWQGFDNAVELMLASIEYFVKKHADEIEIDISKKQREISCDAYKKASKKIEQQMMKYIGG